MKIVLGEFGNDTKVLTEDGRDITTDLHIAEMYISVDPTDLTKVSMTCYVSEVIAHLDPSGVKANLVDLGVTKEQVENCGKIPLKKAVKAFQSPEAILQQFKVKNADLHSD